jgi:hypothetical protein
VATGSDAIASAHADGYFGFTSDTLSIAADNKGTMNVVAAASAPHGIAEAVAYGMHVRGAPVFNSTPATLRGTIDITVAVGETDIDKSYELALGPGQLDVTELADDIADEITAQAVKKDSPVWKQLRKRKK